MSSFIADADALVRAAVEAFNAGDSAAAERHCRAALHSEATHVGAAGVLGLTLHEQQRHAEAEAVFLDLAGRFPGEPEYWCSIGTARRGQRHLDDALAAYAHAAQLGAGSADFYYNVGLTHVDRHDLEAARAVLERAAEQAPQDGEIRLHHAQACHDCLQTERALAALEGWESWEGCSADTWARLAQLLLNLGELPQAMQALQRSAAEPELDAATLICHARVLERINQIDEASRILEQAAAATGASSVNDELLALQGQLAQRRSEHPLAVERYEQALRGITDAALRHFQLFPRARSLEALGRQEEAFSTLQEAHASQAAYIELTSPTASLRGAPDLQVTQQGCDPADVANWDHHGAPAQADSPIFIVGFPRSGTTLLELTLDAHPDLVSMDEQVFVQNALDELVARGAQYPDRLAIDAALVAEVRENYWQRVRRKVQLAPGQRLVDKNPLNILRLPAMMRLFPNARFVFIVRHPCDVLLSCHMQHFRAPDFALLCGDLQRLATGYSHCVDYWYAQSAILQPAQYELRYESFVADFETQTRGLLDFLGLPWDERALAPAASARKKLTSAPPATPKWCSQ
jgi:tetratricopeptide (TPR) repeat protein